MCHVDMYFTEGTSCYDVRMGNREPRFEADSASEADTQAFFHAAQIDHSYPVVFDFEDTHVWIIASYARHLTEQDMYMYCTEEIMRCPSILFMQITVPIT